MLAERVDNLHPTNERSDGHVIITVIYQSHLTLEITDMLLETLPGLYIDSKEVIAILPQLPSGSIFVVEDLLHLLEVPERLPRERIEPVIGSAFETDGNTQLRSRSP